MNVARQVPDVFIIGPMRTASSWIYRYLRSRDDVCLPYGVKETMFFDRRYSKGEEWYFSHFRHFNPAKHVKIVEVSPSYFHCEEAPKRIQQVSQRPRLIVIVRDPVDRSISHFRHLRSRGLVPNNLKEAVKKHPEIVEASRYARCLGLWERVFGEEAIYLLRYEQLLRNARSFVQQLCMIMDIPFVPPPDSLASGKVNTTTIPASPALARVGTRITNILREHKLYLLVEIGKSLGFKRLFFGTRRSVDHETISPGDKAWLREMLETDWQTFQERYGSKVQ